MKTINRKIQWPDDFKIYDKIFFTIAFVFAFFFMSHRDLWETANHSYVFLESVFSGNFLNFYEFCAAHNNSYYYINVANYNIMIYILFGLWELPVFLINNLLGLPLNEVFIIYWAKIVCVAFYIGCGYMVQKLCTELGMNQNKASMAALFFIFNPVAFYSPMAMGQYDTLCLFFTLWALCWYVKGDMTRFSFIIGAGVVFKFFPLLILIPLVLLAEKKIFNVIKYGLTSLCLYIPTTVLFMGRTGNAADFTKAMIDRLFANTVDFSMGKASVFVLSYALIVFLAFLWTPENTKTKNYLAVYLPMVIFGLMFINMYWHSQWLILLMPFVVVTTFLQKNTAPWFWLDIVLSAGFMFINFILYPDWSGALLFSGGVLGHFFGIGANTANTQPIRYFLGLVPYLISMVPVMFNGSILANIVLKIPSGNLTLADRLSDKGNYDKISDKHYLYLVFTVGFIGLWLCPSLLELVNSIGII